MWSPPVIGPVARRRVLIGRAGRHSPVAARAGIIHPCRKRKPPPRCPNARVSQVRSSLRCRPPSHTALLHHAGPATPRRPPFLPTGRSGLPRELTLPALCLAEPPSRLQTELLARVHRVVPLLLSTGRQPPPASTPSRAAGRPARNPTCSSPPPHRTLSAPSMSSPRRSPIRRSPAVATRQHRSPGIGLKPPPTRAVLSSSTRRRPPQAAHGAALPRVAVSVSRSPESGDVAPPELQHPSHAASSPKPHHPRPQSKRATAALSSAAEAQAFVFSHR
jgi:hypothetical protein